MKASNATAGGLASAVCILLLWWPSMAAAQQRPPNYSPDAIPETSFTCENKITGGYYADAEAECQMFHVCVQVSEYEFQDFRFLCPNDTVFDQQNLVCTNWFEVDCQQSVQIFVNDFYHKESNSASNEDVYDYGGDDGDVEYEYEFENDDNGERQHFLGDSSPAPDVHGSPRGVGGRQRAKNRPSTGFHEQQQQGAFDQDEDVRSGGGGGFRNRGRRPPIRNRIRGNLPPGRNEGFFTTRGSRPPPLPRPRPSPRPPRPTPESFPRPSPRPSRPTPGSLPRPHPASTAGSVPPRPHTSTTAFPVGITSTVRPPVVQTTRRQRPRVKSDILLANKNKGKKFGRPVSNSFDDPFRGGGNNLTTVEGGFRPQAGNSFREPEVRPDGRPPRVKSNILQRQGNRGRGGQSHGGKIGSHVEVTTDNILFVSPTPSPNVNFAAGHSVASGDDQQVFVSDFSSGPEVRPDGRPPRVKSDILARKKNKGESALRFRGHKKPVNQNRFNFNRPPTTPAPPPPFVPPRQEFTEAPFSPRQPVTLLPAFSSTESPFTSTRGPVTLIPPFSSTERPFVSTTQQPQFFPSSSAPPPELESNNGDFVEQSFGTERPRTSFRGGALGGRPRVKSDILARQKNRGRVHQGHRQRNRGRFFSRQPTTTAAPPFENDLPEPLVGEERPTFVDEIDEVEEAPHSQGFSGGSSDSFLGGSSGFVRNGGNRGVVVRKKPRVKSDILAAKKHRLKNRFRSGGGRAVGNQGFRTNNDVRFESEEGACSNPFKCPPTQVADGRRPRVKSNLKARRRKFHNRFSFNRNRASTTHSQPQQAPARSQQQQERERQTQQELNELLDQLKERRRGKAVDRRLPRPEENDIHADDRPFTATVRPIVTTPGAPAFTTRGPFQSVQTTSAADDYYDYDYASESTLAAFSTTPAPFISNEAGTHRPFVSSPGTQRPRVKVGGISTSPRLSGFRPTPPAFFNSGGRSSTLLPIVTTPRPQVTTTLLPISESAFVSTTRAPRSTVAPARRRPPGFPSRKELLQLANGELDIPNFPPRNRELQNGRRFGGQPQEPKQTRFPPRERPTPATHSEENEVEQVTEASLPEREQFQATTPQSPVTLDRGTASAALLHQDPQLPPIPTLPPNSPPAEHISFLDRFNRRGQRKRKNGVKNDGDNDDSDEDQPKRKPRVKSDLQQQQINRWSRKGQQARRAKAGRQAKGVDTSNVVFVTTASPDFSEDENHDDSFNEVDEEPVATTPALPIVASTTPLLPIVSTTRRPRSFSRSRSAFARRPNHFRRPEHVRDAIFATPSPSVSGAPSHDIVDEEEVTTQAAATAAVDENEPHNAAEEEEAEPSVRPDGRRPRVKANIKARESNNRWKKGDGGGGGGGRRHGFGGKRKKPVRVGLPGTSEEEPESSRAGAGRSIDLNEEVKEEEKEEIVEFVEDDQGGNEIVNADDEEPRVRPDGQKPRVKSDLLLRSGGARGLFRKNHFRHSKKVKHRDQPYSAKVEDGEVALVPFAPTPSPAEPTPAAGDSDGGHSQPAFLILGSSPVLNTRAIQTTTETAAAADQDGQESDAGNNAV